MVTPRFLQLPFASTGDRVSVPFPVDPGGLVTYAQGFGPAYEIAPGNPGSEPVPRAETNGLYYDLTDNIRQYQLFGTPPWHPASDNDGVSINYPLNARVLHAGKVWRSLVAANTVEPGTDPTRWVEDVQWGPATTAIFGVVRYATTPEVLARSATDRAVSPAGLGALFDTLLNLPIFPEVEGNGLFSLTNPAGNVRIAAGTSWTHRGAFSYTSAQTDLLTVASKTYHLRWDRVNGFALYDLASGAYNPSAVPETSISFDTTYDSMLIARVVTNAGNVAAITALSNKNRLLQSERRTGTPVSAGAGAYELATSIVLNWARTPTAYTMTGNVLGGSISPDGTLDGYAGYLFNPLVSRYGASCLVATDWATGTTVTGLAAYADYAMAA